MDGFIPNEEPEATVVRKTPRGKPVLTCVTPDRAITPMGANTYAIRTFSFLKS